jgi:hypothetical protein
MELLSRRQWIHGLPLLLLRKEPVFRIAEGIRFIEYGTNSILRILQGTVGVIFGVAIVKSNLLSKWISGAGVVIGAVTIYAGLEVAYLEFGGLTTMIGVSMIIYFIWVGILYYS